MRNKINITNIINTRYGHLCPILSAVKYLFDKRILMLTAVFVGALVFAGEAQATSFFFETKNTEVGIGQKMEITLYLDTEGETVNAFEGIIVLPEILEVTEIRDGDTLVAFWSERPSVESDEMITFGGIVPGGWQGKTGKIFSFVAETKKEGSGIVNMRDARILLHDGKGTETFVKIKPFTLSSREGIPLSSLKLDRDDNEAPEVFTPLLAQDPDIFGGDYFLVFVTQDKASGIDHYEVKETKKLLKDEESGEWETVESPYRLLDQNLKSFVYIRAVDRKGNVRVALFEPTMKTSDRNVLYGSLIVLVMFLILITALVFNRRHSK